MNFKPGDPVWVMVSSTWIMENKPRTGEHAAVIQGTSEKCGECAVCRSSLNYYYVACDSFPIPRQGTYWSACSCIMRPRRDDYQQREGAGSMDTIRSLLKENSFVNAK